MDSNDYDHEKLQKLRERRFTQVQLAKRLNIHEKTVSRAECGKHASFKLLKAITDELGISVADILREKSPENLLS